jgi:hypothetical protein
MVFSAVILSTAGPALADGSWSVAPLNLDFGSTTWSPGSTPPPRLNFTITNSDPSKYLVVAIDKNVAGGPDTGGPINYEHKVVNDQAMCANEQIGPGGTCTQNVIFSPTTSGHFTMTFVITGSLQGVAAGSQSVTVTGDATAVGTTTTTTTTAPTTTTTTVKADLVMGFLDPTLYFENGAFVRRVRVTQHVLIKNHGPHASDGGTVTFHFPEDALSPEEPSGEAVTGCKITRIVEETALGSAVTFEYGVCTLEPFAPGQSRQFSVTYGVKWANLSATATVHVSGKNDPTPDTAGQSIEIELANPFRSSHQLKLGTDYKVTGSRTANNPALK